MKTHNQNSTVSNTRHNSSASQSGGQRPETRDNLDSRSGEEQNDKGDDVTHNKRDTKKDKLHKRGS